MAKCNIIMNTDLCLHKMCMERSCNFLYWAEMKIIILNIKLDQCNPASQDTNVFGRAAFKLGAVTGVRLAKPV